MDIVYHRDHNMRTHKGLRTWIDCISETKPGAMCWFGTRCSSFVGICRRHHQRCEANGFWGDRRLPFVKEGNIMIVVTALAMLFAFFCDSSPVLEQPTTSVMPKLDVMHCVLTTIGSRKTLVWHGAYSGTSPKPLQLWSHHDLSMVARNKPRGLTGTLHTSVIKPSGKVVYSGNKKALKASQAYCLAFGKAVASVAKTWVNHHSN